ncbi:unnamed protein product [Rotaria magnacalcarata]|uniref:Uncharacterized protein n=1 Tax=Rotaria magnacalcarata TaxID=392030 RepID=A0A816ZE32_9BILA|nr:unnamed protein product [Rotaria magnacalcarata]
MTLNRNTNIVIDFTGSAWAGEIKMSSGVGANFWSVVALIDPTQKYPINTSPGMFATKMKKEINYYSPFLHHVSVTGSLPLIRVIEGQVAVIQIPAADWDRTADARCRWVSSTGAAGDECDDICNNLPSAVLSLSLIFTTVNRFSLFDSECTITWTAVRRPVDGALTTGTYLVAIMVEDFVNTASMTPMSPVPLQMLIYTYQPASGSCSTKSEVTGDRPNRVCIATSSVYRLSRNGTYIQIYNKANPSTPEWQVDCGYSSDCICTGQTVLFYVRNANGTPGAYYYILFSSGAASGNIFCSLESDPITDNLLITKKKYTIECFISLIIGTSYWNFNIWNPAVSSTQTTTTTPPTTGTITT